MKLNKLLICRADDRD